MFLETYNNLEVAFQNNPWLIVIIILWVLPWKGVALWKAARNNHRRWFAVMLVINTLAILEAVYIFHFCKKHKRGGGAKNK